MNENFKIGFEKVALYDKRWKEDLAVAGTSALPYGTTAHTALSKRPKDTKLKEWASRIGLGTLTGTVAALPGALMMVKAIRTQNPDLYRKALATTYAGAIPGTALGEVAASRMIHSDAYDNKGNLKKGYK